MSGHYINGLLPHITGKLFYSFIVTASTDFKLAKQACSD